MPVIFILVVGPNKLEISWLEVSLKSQLRVTYRVYEGQFEETLLGEEQHF